MAQLLRGRGVSYVVGFILYFVAMVVFLLSVVIPGIWIYDKENADSKTSVGRSLWFTNVRTCLSGHGYMLSRGWRCDTLPVDLYQYSRQVAGVVLVVGVVVQTAACVILLLINTVTVPGSRSCFYAELTAGIAVMLSVSGLLLYTRVTHHAVNVTFGPGYILSWCAAFLAYLGLLLTALSYSLPQPCPSHRDGTQI